MGDVLEHVRRPRETLREIHRLLQPGGVLVASTPNAGSAFARASLRVARMLRMPWVWSAAPYHLFEFSPDAISRLMARAGLRVTELACYGRPSFLYMLGASGYFDDLKRSMKRDGRYRFNWRLIANLPKLVGVALLLVPSIVYGAVAGRRSGHRMLITARRFD